VAEMSEIHYRLVFHDSPFVSAAFQR